MDNLETPLATTVDNYRGNASGAILERFIKPRASSIFVHPAYSLDGPGPSIAISGPHENFQQCFQYMDRRKTPFRCMLQTNKYAKIMEGSRTKVA